MINYVKRLTAMLLVLVMLFTMLPAQPVSASVDSSEKAAIHSAVSKVIKDYAKKVYQAEADENAAGHG